MKIGIGLIFAAVIGLSVSASAQDEYMGARPAPGGYPAGTDYRDGNRYRGEGRYGYSNVYRSTNEYADRDCEVETVHRNGRTIRIHRCY
jgi:hypothetical protein